MDPGVSGCHWRSKVTGNWWFRGANATLKGHWAINVIYGDDWEAGGLTQKLGIF